MSESTSTRILVTWRHPAPGGRYYRLDDQGYVTSAATLDGDWSPMRRHATADCHAFAAALAHHLFLIAWAGGI